MPMSAPIQAPLITSTGKCTPTYTCAKAIENVQNKGKTIAHLKCLPNSTTKKTANAKWLEACDEGKLKPVPQSTSVRTLNPGVLQGLKRATQGLSILADV